jgi:uncharacterized protein
MPARVVVDAHTHLLPERLAAAIRRYFDEHFEEDLPYPWQASRIRQELVAAGVARCWSLPYAHRAGMASALNRSMAEAFPPSDPLVIPGATVHPGDDVERVLDEAIGGLGLGVFKLHCAVGSFPADDRRLEPLWRRVSSTGQPAVVHVGRSAAGTTTAHDLQRLADVAERWPDARIVVAHCGAPLVAETLALLRRTRSVLADLTPVVGTLVPLVRDDVAGLERRLLFGSDVPNVAVTIEAALAHVRAWGLAPDDEAAVLGGTARALLGRSSREGA